MKEIEINIIKPDGVKLAGNFEHIIVPGVDGDFGILPGHTPFITKVRPGVISLFENGHEDKYSIHDGFVTVENDIVNIVCDTIEHISEIDENRAKDATERAERRLKSNEGDIDFRRAEQALKRALVRLDIKQG